MDINNPKVAAALAKRKKLLGPDSDYKPSQLESLLRLSFVSPYIGGMRDPHFYTEKFVEFLKKHAKYKVSHIICLMKFPDKNLKDSLTPLGITYIHLPIQDFHPPSLEDMKKAVFIMKSCTNDKKCCLVHCAAGCGRTGSILAAYLVTLQTSKPTLEDILKRIRDKRPCSVETRLQEASIQEYIDYYFDNVKENPKSNAQDSVSTTIFPAKPLEEDEEEETVKS